MRPVYMPAMPERLVKIDAEIWATQQKLNEIPPIQIAAALKEKLADLEKRRAEVMAELEKKAKSDEPE
jgi:hypothetical protein